MTDNRGNNRNRYLLFSFKFICLFLWISIINHKKNKTYAVPKGITKYLLLDVITIIRSKTTDMGKAYF